MEEVVGSIPTRSTIFNYLPILRFSVWRHWVSFGTNASLALFDVFTPALAKHSKSFSLIDCISVGRAKRWKVHLDGSP